MNRWHTLAFVVVLGVGSTAYACSFADSPGPTGILGSHAFRDTGIDNLPANLASWSSTDGAAFTNEGIEFYRPVDDGPWMYGESELVLSDVEDLMPPSKPVVTMAYSVFTEGDTGCGGTCGPTGRHFLEVEAEDDMAVRERLTYAVYFSDAPDTERTMPDDVTIEQRDEIWVWGRVADQGTELYVRVRAIDQAGNVSEMSDPVRVDTGTSGCSTGHRSGGLLVPLLLALGLVSRRKRA